MRSWSGRTPWRFVRRLRKLASRADVAPRALSWSREPASGALKRRARRQRFPLRTSCRPLLDRLLRRLPLDRRPLRPRTPPLRAWLLKGQEVLLADRPHSRRRSGRHADRLEQTPPPPRRAALPRPRSPWSAPTAPMPLQASAATRLSPAPLRDVEPLGEEPRGFRDVAAEQGKPAEVDQGERHAPGVAQARGRGRAPPRAGRLHARRVPAGPARRSRA